MSNKLLQQTLSSSVIELPSRRSFFCSGGKLTLSAMGIAMFLFTSRMLSKLS